MKNLEYHKFHGSISGNQTICAGGDPGVISSLASATGSGNIT